MYKQSEIPFHFTPVNSNQVLLGLRRDDVTRIIYLCIFRNRCSSRWWSSACRLRHSSTPRHPPCRSRCCSDHPRNQYRGNLYLRAYVRAWRTSVPRFVDAQCCTPSQCCFMAGVNWRIQADKFVVRVGFITFVTSSTHTRRFDDAENIVTLSASIARENEHQENYRNQHIFPNLLIRTVLCSATLLYNLNTFCGFVIVWQ